MGVGQPTPALAQKLPAGGTVVDMRIGTNLKVRATADGGQDQVFTFSLKGFTQALDRIIVLVK